MSAILLSPDNPGAIVPLAPDDRSVEDKKDEIKERQQDAPELLEYLKKTCKAIKGIKEQDWRRIRQSQVRCTMYYDDRQYLNTNADGMWQDSPTRDGDIRPIDNQYKIQVDKLLMEIARSLTDLSVKATDENDTVMQEGAKFAKYRLVANRKKILTNTFRLREAQALLLKTITYRYTCFNPDAEDSPLERKYKKSQKQFGSTRSITTCADCGAPMKQTSDENTCIQCGGHNAKPVEISGDQKEMIDGYDEVRGGRVETRHIDPGMVRISLDARETVADSPFLWHEQTIMRCILEAAYPDVKIPTSSELSQQAQYQQNAERAPSNAPYGWLENQGTSGTGGTDSSYSEGGNQFEELPFSLIWIDPVVYQNHPGFLKPQKLLGGRTLPAGTKPITLFPDGMCIALGPADTVLDVYPENKNKKWTFCVYGIREHALHGSGTNALLGPQDTRNDLKAYMIANTFLNAAPREFVRAGAITGNQLPAMHQTAIVNNVPDDQPVMRYAYDKAIGSPLPQQTFELFQAEGGAMQEGAGTSSLSSEGAAPDVKAMGTATGVAAIRDMAVGRMGPNLMLLATMEEQHGYQILEHEQENFSRTRFRKMANQSIATEDTDGSLSFSAEGIEAFMNCNVRADLTIEAVPGSWMPRTEAERQAKLTGFASFAGEIIAKMTNPTTGLLDPRAEDLLAIGADVFGVDINIDGWTASERIAASRLKDYARTVSILEKHGFTVPEGWTAPTPQPTPGQQPDPMAALQPAPPHPLVVEILKMTPEAVMSKECDEHAAFMAFYLKWWESDEGRAASSTLKAVVTQLVIMHRAGAVYALQQKGLDKIKADAPAMVAAQQTQAEAAPQGPTTAQKIAESISYKDAPPDIKRQMEAQAGMQPSQAQPPTDDGTGAEVAKAQAQLATQEHAHQLDSAQAVQSTQLKLAEQTHAAQLKQDELEAEHNREMAKMQAQHGHEEGMRGAEMLNEQVSGAQDREHQSAMADRQHEGQKELVKMKPPTTGNKT